jgi:hypothetical protein
MRGYKKMRVLVLAHVLQLSLGYVVVLSATADSALLTGCPLKQQSHAATLL